MKSVKCRDGSRALIEFVNSVLCKTLIVLMVFVTRKSDACLIKVVGGVGVLLCRRFGLLHHGWTPSEFERGTAEGVNVSTFVFSYFFPPRDESTKGYKNGYN